MRFLGLGCLVTLLACSPAATIKPEEKPVPANLAVPPGNALLVKAYAKGVQIYTCKPEGWVLKAPEADLFDEKGAKIGHHSGGPTWELAADNSAVVGEMKEKAAVPDSIPWLLVAKKSSRGDGMFSRVTYIQRLDTAGGKAPAGGCDAAHQGSEVRVDYTATYSFYAAQ
jgi:hypothetical protein